ncbi:MAG: hypothetical protein FWC10_02875 [Lentimicrobiaceae bacterium]|nr:hypothetical protein [Lentimicrobiaceae bacterium]
MNKCMKYKLLLLSISIFLLISESKSQIVAPNCLHYPYNTQVGINLNINMLNKMRIQQNYYTRSSPSEYLRSYPSLGADLGVYLYQRIYKWFGIQIGAEYSALTLIYGNTAKFDAEHYVTMGYYGFGAFTFPILFNCSYYFNEKHGLDISLGGAPLLLFLGDAGQSVTDGSSMKGIRHKTRLKNNNRYNFSLCGKIGYNFLFKNKNTLGVAIVGSYAAEPYANGNYHVDINDIEVEKGYLFLHNTFIGLQFSYGFTMKKLLCKADK